MSEIPIDCEDNMKRLVLTALALSLLSSPVYADTFDDLVAERNQLFARMMESGGGTDAEASRFDALCKQINQIAEERFSNNTRKLQGLMGQLGGQQQKNEAIRSSLFGGSINPNNSNTTNDKGHQEPPSRVHSPVPQLLGGSSPIPGSSNESFKELKGGATSINYQIDNLIDKALEKNVEANAAKTAVDFYSRPIQKFLANQKDGLNYLIPYRGFSPSVEAGKVILGEETKTKSLVAALYRHQLIIDKTHLQIMTAVMQLAMDMGGQENSGKGAKALALLVGEEETNNISKSFLNPTTQPPDRPLWDVTTRQQKQQLLFKAALDKDPSVQEIINSVEKYTKVSKASSIIMPALGLGSMIPSFIGPACRGALVTYIELKGGAVEVRLLKELYLDKRLNSRTELINEEAHLAVDCVEAAVATGNPVLMSAAQSLMEQMSSPEIAAKVLE